MAGAEPVVAQGMAWGWAAESLAADSLLFAVFYALVGAHCWDNRQKAAALGVRLARTFAACFATGQQQHSDKRTPDTIAEDAWVHAQMGQLRAQNYRRMGDVVSVVVPTAIGIMSLCWRRFAHTQYYYNGMLFLTMAIIQLGVRWITRRCGVQFTPGRARFLYVVANMAGMCRTLVSDPSPYFYMVNGARAAFRVVCTVSVFDTRLSCVVNLLWSVVLVYFEVYKQQRLAPCSLSANAPAIMIGAELGMLVFLVGVSWFVEEFVEAHVRLNLGVISARNVQQAVRRVLSVLCDAELQLSPTLEICHPSRKAAHLLAPEKQAGPAAVAGRNFQDFIAEADQDRFHEFLSASAGATSVGAEPPRSTQLRICDSMGSSVPVEIFHANLPAVESSGRPGHLLGIRECAPGHMEAPAPAEPRGPTLGPGYPRQPLQPTVRGGQEGQVGPNAAPRNRNAGGDGASDRSSNSASSVATVVRRTSLPELAGIEIRFDGLDGSMPIKEVRCRFSLSRVASAPQQLPSLPDWVHNSMRKGLKDWIQENVNLVCSGRECGEPFAPLMLQWPYDRVLGGISREEPLVLEATEVDLVALDSDDEETEEGEQELEEEMGMVLRLSSFNQVSMLPGRHRRPRSVRSAHSARSASRSALGFGGGSWQLPSIGEAGTERVGEQPSPAVGPAGTEHGGERRLQSIGEAGSDRGREQRSTPTGQSAADQSAEHLRSVGEVGVDRADERRLPPLGETGADECLERLPPSATEAGAGRVAAASRRAS